MPILISPLNPPVCFANIIHAFGSTTFLPYITMSASSKHPLKAYSLTGVTLKTQIKNGIVQRHDLPTVLNRVSTIRNRWYYFTLLPSDPARPTTKRNRPEKSVKPAI